MHPVFLHFLNPGPGCACVGCAELCGWNGGSAAPTGAGVCAGAGGDCWPGDL